VHETGQPSPSPSIPASTEAFAQATYWLSNCIQNHDRCPSNQDVPLPTRLLYFKHGGERLHVRLAETLGLVGGNACLSYRWGKQGAAEPLQTERGNYRDHLKEISVQSLPRTFQHAIVSPRRLGLQYLGIDSLCIIQNDNPDWCTEAAKMGLFLSECVRYHRSFMVARAKRGMLLIRGTGVYWTPAISTGRLYR
jgi:hypothetical protein